MLPFLCCHSLLNLLSVFNSNDCFPLSAKYWNNWCSVMVLCRYPIVLVIKAMPLLSKIIIRCFTSLDWMGNEETKTKHSFHIYLPTATIISHNQSLFLSLFFFFFHCTLLSPFSLLRLLGFPFHYSTYALSS